jgi:hypothetical protein
VCGLVRIGFSRSADALLARLIGGGFRLYCRDTMRALIVCVASSFALAGMAPSLQGGRPPDGLYDAHPNHLWNRIHQTLHVRVAADGSRYGFDTVDPLLWRKTRHLLSGPSHKGAVSVLDEFLISGGERLIADPLRRAVFQHDLWTIFDWLVSTSEGDKSARTALEHRLARVIRRLALTRRDIDTLPDSYVAAVASGAFATNGSQEQPVLPSDLFTAPGPWVNVTVGGLEPLVPQHAAELSRSSFLVLWSVPGGSTDTARYLKKLWDFPAPFVSDEGFQLGRDGELRAKVNPAMPEIPEGTRLALVRKMLLIDNAGAIVPSNVVESIQLRTFRRPHAFSELRMSRADLFGGRSGGLRAVTADEKDFVTFSAKGMDPFDDQLGREPLNFARVLQGCRNCHHVEFERAIDTVLSLRRMLKPWPLVDSRHERWARWYTQPIAATEAKRRSFEWGRIEGLWQTQPR